MISATAMIDTDFIGHCEYCRRPTASRDSDGDWACANGTGCARPVLIVARQDSNPHLTRGRIPGSRNKFVEFNGQIKTMGQWAEFYGFCKNALLQHRDAYGWTNEQELEFREKSKHCEQTPRRRHRSDQVISVDGVEHTLAEWAVVLETTMAAMKASAKRHNRDMPEQIRHKMRKLAAKKGGAR